ncbi:rhox homeobox family member 1-like [Peromyscus maniculatus bairdii]|uniref:rhox homeobox family member 1-like n=1 Tax=Peromyscus maniculatus bairdii TaxID=230844 RepID=UPI003FD59A39
MENLHNYNDNFCHHLEEYEDDIGPHPEHEGASESGGRDYEGALSLDNSENQQGNLNQGGHMSLGPEGDHSNQVAMEADPEEPAIFLAEVPRRQSSRHQIQFHFTQWQVQEMETIFQETQYPDVLTRRVLARSMNVPEAKVQVSKSEKAWGGAGHLEHFRSWTSCPGSFSVGV